MFENYSEFHFFSVLLILIFSFHVLSRTRRGCVCRKLPEHRRFRPARQLRHFHRSIAANPTRTCPQRTRICSTTLKSPPFIQNRRKRPTMTQTIATRLTFSSLMVSLKNRRRAVCTNRFVNIKVSLGQRALSLARFCA